MSVYFAQAGAYVKIGYSHNPISRSATITTTGTRPADLPRGADVTFLGWVPGDTWTERAWHVRFAEDRVAGEWFYLAPDVVREAIWADPAGIDAVRMPALTVFVARDHPGVTRQQLVDAGLEMEATTLAEARMRFNSIMAPGEAAA